MMNIRKKSIHFFRDSILDRFRSDSFHFKLYCFTYSLGLGASKNIHQSYPKRANLEIKYPFPDQSSHRISLSHFKTAVSPPMLAWMRDYYIRSCISYKNTAG